MANHIPQPDSQIMAVHDYNAENTHRTYHNFTTMTSIGNALEEQSQRYWTVPYQYNSTPGTRVPDTP